MRPTAYQYDEAIKRLQDAKTQIEPDGNCCAVCGDSGHQAHTCGFNPLVAMMICKGVADAALILHDKYHDREGGPNKPSSDTVKRTHEFLHWLAGFDMHMGEQCGPAKVIVPPVSKEEDPNVEKK